MVTVPVDDCCESCGEGPSWEKGPVDTFWATAELMAIEPGMYHWPCAKSLAALVQVTSG